ncbi:MAG: SpoIIE family protein phosphatase [Bacteroidales bacterium]|nr:SpoIIE family protein phosphatase [Bacteroidales bacterium]
MHLRKTYQSLVFLMVIFLPCILQAQIPSKIPESKRTEAEEYLQRIEMNRSQGNKSQESNYLNKLAYLYWESNATTEAIDCFNQSLKINEEINNQNAIQAICTNLGTLYTDLGQYQKATDQYNRALSINQTLKRKQSVAGNLLNLANVKMLEQENIKAIAYLEEALELAKEINNMNYIRQCYGMLAETNNRVGNSKKAIEYNNLFLTFDQYIKNEQMNQLEEETQQKINQAQAEKRATEYALDERTDQLKSTQDSLKQSAEEVLLMQELNKAKEAMLHEQNEKLKIEKRIRWISIIGLIILLFYSFVVYLQLKQKRKANKLLEAQNEEILRQQEEILEQKRKLELQNKHIESGIRYAQNIQQAVLAIREEVDKELDCFIIYRPKEMVSGDFYWFSRAEIDDEEQLFAAVVDCTGHGVPGAFMSLIGNRLLSEIVNERMIHDPALIMEHLNTQVKIALRQRETDNHDGMDVCLCRLEKTKQNTTKVVFCGSKRPLIYYKQTEAQIVVVKGDRRSLGGIVPEWDDTDFTNQEIELSKGDLIYLSSDGFVDQDSPDAVKFGTKNLLELLNNIATLPLDKQKEHLENELEKFMNGNDQVDDITILGIRI